MPNYLYDLEAQELANGDWALLIHCEAAYAQTVNIATQNFVIERRFDATGYAAVTIPRQLFNGINASDLQIQIQPKASV